MTYTPSVGARIYAVVEYTAHDGSTVTPVVKRLIVRDYASANMLSCYTDDLDREPLQVPLRNVVSGSTGLKITGHDAALTERLLQYRDTREEDPWLLREIRNDIQVEWELLQNAKQLIVEEFSRSGCVNKPW